MMKKYSTGLLYFFVGSFSFLVFVYFTFPYYILKEALASQISSALEVSVALEELEPKFPLGVSLKNANFATASGAALNLKAMNIRISLLKLLIGKVQLSLELYDSQKGYIDMSVARSLFSMGKDDLPFSSLGIDSKDFDFGALVNFVVAMKAASPTTDLLLKPILEKLVVKGKMTTNITLFLDSSDPAGSKGNIDLKVQEGLLNFGPSMSIPDQVFEVAEVKGLLEAGNLTIDPLSKFQAKELVLTFGGTVTQKSPLETSALDLKIGVELTESLKESFSFVMDAISNTQTNGKMHIGISGYLMGQKNFTFE